MIARFRQHWPEYVLEAFGLGLFMVSACAFGALLEHPNSPVHRALPSPAARRALMGLAMGLTAIVNIYSPWGRRSGAHLNPSVSLTFYRLRKTSGIDALFYAFFQFAGAIAGVAAAWAALGSILAEPSVNFVVTRPGVDGIALAFLSELAIAGVLMFVILTAANTPSLAPRTGLFAGALVALWITIEAPLSGMSMNPARSFGSALAAREWSGFWIYLVAPPIGMLAAAELWVRLRGANSVICAKLHHDSRFRCIFDCGYQSLTTP